MTAKTGVIYLQKDKFQLYSPNLAQIVEFRFPAEVVRDLDILKKGLLESLVKVFVTNCKLPPSNLVIFLADNTYFVRDFILPTPPPAAKTAQPSPAQPTITLENLQQEANKYIEHVPYDNVVSKTLPLKNGFRICAANRDFYEAVKGAFEMAGFTIESVLPGMVLGNNFNAKPIMDGNMAQTVLQRAGALKQYDLLTQSTAEQESEKNTENSEDTEVDPQVNKKPDKKRVIVLAGILASLVVVLILVYVQSQTPPTPPQQPAQAQSPEAVKPASTVNITVSTAVPTASAVASPASASVDKLPIQIVNTTSNATQAQALRAQLTKLSFDSVTLQTQSSVGTATTIVTFTSAVNQIVRNTILEEVKKIKPTITVQERQSATPEISIILGN